MYIDVVLCQHSGDPKYFLFQAPAFSRLKKDEKVIVQTNRGECEAKVVNLLTVDTDSEELKFIMDWLHYECKATELKKVLKRVSYTDLIYEDERE